MSRKPDASGRPHAASFSATIQASLIETLVTQQGTLLIGSIISIALGLFCWVFSREPALLVFSGASFVINGLRLWSGLVQARKLVHARKDGAARFTRGVRCYIIGATANALAWGGISAFVVLRSTPVEQMAILGGMLGYAGASAVRNSAIPKVVFVQVIPPFVMTMLACLWTGKPFYMVYSVFVLVNLLMLLSMVKTLSHKTRALLIAEERAAAAIESLAQANRSLQAKTLTDPLTGAVNRRGFDLALIRECAKAKRERQPLSLLMLDLDHFKSLNDTLGHQAGDDCLQRLTQCLARAVRGPNDIVARYGGEEFAIILPTTDSKDAAMIAENVRSMVLALGVSHPKNVFGMATVSVGHATADADGVQDGVKLVGLADDALYRAKMSGRNQVRGPRKCDVKRSAAAIAFPILKAIETADA